MFPVQMHLRNNKNKSEQTIQIKNKTPSSNPLFLGSCLQRVAVENVMKNIQILKRYKNKIINKDVCKYSS